MNLAYDAMVFAREVHEGHARKHTGNPYFDHLAEVVGIVSAVDNSPVTMAVGWLHDCRTDCGVSGDVIEDRFGIPVAVGVSLLSDFEQGTRAQRKAAARERLARAPSWVQSLKCADIISNTGSIVTHDPAFARVYLPENLLLLDRLAAADHRLLTIATKQVNAGMVALGMTQPSEG